MTRQPVSQQSAERERWLCPFWAKPRTLCALAVSTTLWGSVSAAAPVCKPGIVRRDGRIIAASWGAGEAASSASAPSPGGRRVRLRYLAHSSFLITAPGGARVLTDPYFGPAVVTPPPDAVTVSNLHETHSQVGPYVSKAPILYGATPKGKPHLLERFVRGLRIVAFPQVEGGAGAPFVVNTIFVFQAAGLCIAHLGNARFGPSPGQIRALGKIHVLLVPIDGYITVPHEVAAKTAKRIGPNLVIPMHYFGPELPAQFAAALRAEGIGRMVRARSAEITLSLRRLPPPTVYMVMPNAEAP